MPRAQDPDKQEKTGSSQNCVPGKLGRCFWAFRARCFQLWYMVLGVVKVKSKHATPSKAISSLKTSRFSNPGTIPLRGEVFAINGDPCM
jgi:hypothetical protein